MYFEKNDFLKKVPTKVWLIGGGVFASILSVWMLALLIHRPSTTPEAAPATMRAAVNGWQIELTGAASDPGVSQFNGFFPMGKTAFIPAGAEFAILSQPTGIRGELDDGGASAAWSANGGKIDAGAATPAGTRQRARAPMQPGLYRLTWNSSPNAAKSLVPAAANLTSDASPPLGLDVLVLAEAEAGTKGERTTLKVNGKPIGGYLDPTKSTSKRVRDNAKAYQIPRFFATLTPESAKIRLGPDFELGELIAFMDDKDKDGKKVITTNRHTDVLPLRLELIDKLVKLRERLRQKGVKITRFAVSSGFRTPDYNKQIGGVPFSRHCYGDAVDIYIDENNDHHMDDLNGDGKFDRKDGEVIANACRELELEGAVVPGGIGVYEWHGDDSVRSHVHIDCRGFITRWGQIESGKFKKMFRWWPAAEFQEGENGE